MSYCKFDDLVFNCFKNIYNEDFENLDIDIIERLALFLSHFIANSNNDFDYNMFKDVFNTAPTKKNHYFVRLLLEKIHYNNSKKTNFCLIINDKFKNFLPSENTPNWK